MKFTFGFYNGCYWLFISTAEQLVYAVENFKMTQTEACVYLEYLAKGRTVFLNEAGGYHTGYESDTDKTQRVVKEGRRFPSNMDRIKVMEQEVTNDIHAIQDKMGIPRTENLVFD